MCGIVGALMKNNAGFYTKQEDVFFQMLYADAIRGYDSTGVVGVERHGGFHIAKEAAEATWVIPQIKAEKFFTDRMSGTKPEGKAWIGHNRKSTVGKTTDDNAHPFVVNNEFAMVHNGTLHNHKQLADVEVDSEALAITLHKAMGEKDWKVAMEEALGKVYGAYACVWYDQRSNKVHLLRNAERPLSIIETPDAFFWASEAAMAWWILTRNQYTPEQCKHHALDPHMLVTFDIEKTDLEVTELTPKKATPPATTPVAGGSITRSFGGSTAKGTTQTPSKKGGKSCSGWSNKQQKNFRNAWLGKPLRFWIDDYVSRDFPKTYDEGAREFFLLGEHEDILLKHTVHAEVDLAKLKIEDEEDITARTWKGNVESIDFDLRTGYIHLYVSDAKPIIRSKPANQAPFPKNPYTTPEAGLKERIEEAVRARVKHMKEAYEETYGEVYEEMTPQGKIVLKVKNGLLKDEIVYETPVTLH